jgi:hypothetical protein
MSSNVKRTMKSEHVAVRIHPEVLKRMKRAANAGDYPLTISQIVTRGIELALRELEQRQQRS